MPLLLDVLTEEVHNLYKGPSPVWRPYTPSSHDMKEMEKNSAGNNSFDKESLKHKVWVDYKNGSYNCVSQQCDYGIVVALLPKDAKIPVEDWGRIFQGFGLSSSGHPWKV